MEDIELYCGHEVTKRTDMVFQSVMDWGKNLDRIINYAPYCRKCARDNESAGVVLHNKREEKAWLDGKLEYPDK
jgi:hypothetical protein